MPRMPHFPSFSTCKPQITTLGRGKIFFIFFLQLQGSGRFTAAGEGARGADAEVPHAAPGPAPSRSGPLAPRGPWGRAERAGADWFGPRSAQDRPIKAPRGRRLCVGISCGDSRCARPRVPDRSARRRVMTTKAVCVLKGEGPVHGDIHFEQKARAGDQAGGEVVPAHL